MLGQTSACTSFTLPYILTAAHSRHFSCGTRVASRWIAYRHSTAPLARRAASAMPRGRVDSFPASAMDSDKAAIANGSHMVAIDGSMLEGGGQILRNAAALASITGVDMRIDNIRAGRKQPGLRPQHLSGLRLIAEMCGGSLEGGDVGSRAVTLRPGRLQPGTFEADTQTAGSCMLMAQASLPCALFAGGSSAAPDAAASGDTFTIELNLRGGTDAAMAPPFGYSQHVLLPVLSRHLGLSVHMEAHKRGFFPKGGGSVTVRVPGLTAGQTLRPVQLTERGQVTAVHIDAISCGRMKVTIAERMIVAAQKAVKQGDPSLRSVKISSTAWQPPATAEGGSIVLVAETDTGCLLGASALAERGVTAEDVGRKAGEALVEALASGACVDDWLQDQLVIFMALAEGDSAVLCAEPTLHTRTAIQVAEQLTSARFSIQKKGETDSRYLITCTGAAIVAGRCEQ